MITIQEQIRHQMLLCLTTENKKLVAKAQWEERTTRWDETKRSSRTTSLEGTITRLEHKHEMEAAILETLKKSVKK